MVLHQDLFTSAERRRIYIYVCGVVLKSQIGVCIYIAVTKYILGIHALDSDESLLSITLLVIGFVWLLLTLLFASSLLGLYIKRISTFSKQEGLCTRFERHAISWTVMLLFAALCFSNPVQLATYFTKLAHLSWKPSVLFSTIPSFVCETIFFTALMFYGWAMVHGFRLEEGWSIAAFYTPKLATIGMLLFSKFVAAFRHGLYLSSLPFASFFSMLKLSSLTNPTSISSLQSRAVLGITILEMLVILAIGIDFGRAYSVTRQRKDRLQTIRCHFFLHRYSIILTGMYFGYLGLSFFLNSGSFGKSLGGKTKATFLVLTRQEAMMVFMAYSLIEAFLNLPGQKYRLFLFRSLDENMVTNPVSYSDHEGENPSVKNEFVCERNVELLNLNFAAHYLSTPDPGLLFDVKQTLKREGYDLFASTTSNSPTTCKASVFTSTEHSKVIICILGPSDYQVKATLRPYPDNIGDSIEHILSAQQQFSKKQASVHHGFVLMYADIATELNNILIKCLESWKETKPMLLFTGYSLGGALATLSSLDVAIRHELPPNTVIIETFGAPRIGNEAFVSFYNYRLPLHWRVITDGDVVPRMPGAKYFSVGLDAVLTDGGKLVLDPTSLIAPRVRNGKGLSAVQMAARHKRIAYLLALRSWTEFHRINEYNIKSAKRLWAWPVRPEETTHLPDYGFQRSPEKVV